MFNRPQELQKTNYSRFLVKRSPIKELPNSEKNIFSLEKSNLLQDLNDIKKTQNTLSQYQICGDKEFKRTFIKNKLQQYNNLFVSPNPQQHSPELSQQFESPQAKNTATNFTKQPFQDTKQTIYMNSKHHETFLSTLHKTQKNTMTRERQTLQRFRQTQKSWENIDSYIKLRLPKTETVTFGSVKKVYVHENPEKLELINDMLPKYWQYSLRNNDKKLKSYAKGHKFTHEKAEEMLQTLKGTKKLEHSIPRISSERVNRDFTNSEKISLKAHSIERDQSHQTMRQFHKNLYQTLNQTIRERGSSIQATKSKLNSSRFSSLKNRTFLAPKDQQMDLTEQLNEKEKKVYEFCKDLERLDRVDNQVYVKKYERKSKWLHEGMEIGERS